MPDRTTVEMTQEDGSPANVCAEDVSKYESLGWKVKKAEDATPVSDPKTQDDPKSKGGAKASSGAK